MTKRSLLLPVAACLLAVPPPARADAPAPSVAELLRQLPACESLETCPATKALIARGPAIWPEIRAGLTAEEELTRFWTLGILSEVVVKEAIPALAERLDDSFIRVRAAAAYALGAQRDKAVTPHLLRALADKDLNVRFAATVALGRVKDPAAVPALLEACRDRDEDVRAYAALALGDIGDRRATPRLVERLEQDVVAQVRGFAAMALGSLGDPAALKPLLASLASEKDAKALAAAVHAVGAQGDPSAIPALEKLEDHEDPDVRAYVKEALAVLRKAPAPPAEPPPR